MNEQYKTGDIVEVLDNGTAGKHMKGVTTRVVEGNEDGADYVFVEDPTGNGLFTQYGDTTSWIIDNENLRLVTEGLAEWEKELLGIKTKQELKVGDTVRVLKTSNWHKLGETGKVQGVSSDDTIRVNDWWISPKEVELVTEKPKARSQEIVLGDVQKNDLIVCFWSQGGVETRKKGVAHEKDDDGDWQTEDGEYLTWSDEHDTTAEHIYLLDRPEVKEPELADGTYWVTDEDVNDDCWWKVEVKDSKATWGIRGDMTDVAFSDYDYLVEASKANWHVVHTTNPFPEPSNLEKFERAGVIGTRYRSGNVLYKVTKKGKVKGIIMNDARDSWQTVIWDFETFQGYVDSGLIRKIS